MKKLLKVKLTVTLKSPMQRCRRNLQNLMRQAPFEIDLRFYRASHGIALLFLDLLSRLLSATPVLTLDRQKHQLTEFRTKCDHSSFPRDHSFSGPPLCWARI
jgi:hypothetical protein